MNIFKNIFKKKEALNFQDIPLNVDFHSHLLPGLDDGAKDLDESIKLIKTLNEEYGFEKFLTTPHVMTGVYQNNPETINNALDRVKKGLRDHDIHVKIEASAEYYIDEYLENKIQSDEILPFAGKYVLVETSFMDEPLNLYDIFFKLKLKGYKPVFAHPERYMYLANDFEKFRDLVDREVLIQINLGSLAGFYSPGAKKIAEDLIDQGLVHLVGSDIHSMNQINLFDEVTKTKGFRKLRDLDLLNNSLMD